MCCSFFPFYVELSLLFLFHFYYIFFQLSLLLLIQQQNTHDAMYVLVVYI